jgi:hypothetical protein
VPAKARSCCLNSSRGRRDRAVLGHPVGGHDNAVHPVPEGYGAEPQLGPADFRDDGGNRRRILGHLHLAQQRLDPGGLAGEADAEQLAHRAAATVAADEVARAQLRAVGQLDGHPVVVLAQPDQFAAAPDLDAELGGVLGQQAIGGGLRDAEDVRMCGVQPVRPRLDDAGEETTDRELLAEREEPLQQTALVHHLDAAHVQADLLPRACEVHSPLSRIGAHVGRSLLCTIRLASNHMRRVRSGRL